MNLKRNNSSNSSNSLNNNQSIESHGWISREASGLSFDFVPNDSNTYVVGTEEGTIHKCSISYNEQYLDNYYGHNGPVYR